MRWNPENFERTDLRNKRFGKLTVIRYDADVKRWLCLCDCGNLTHRAATRMRNGDHKSCGCLISESAKGVKTYKQKPYAVERGLFGAYRSGARRRGLEFDLTFEQALELFTSNCFYCGMPPMQVRKDTTLDNRHFLYNGIDRKNSDRGYVLGNVVPACAQCNIAKGTTNMADFRTWVQSIYKHWILKGNPVPRPELGTPVRRRRRT